MHEPRTGPAHYTEARHLANFADSVYRDLNTTALPRSAYSSDAEYTQAMAQAREKYAQDVATVHAYAALAQVHATLALTAATLECGGILDGPGAGLRRDAWHSVCSGLHDPGEDD